MTALKVKKLLKKENFDNLSDISNKCEQNNNFPDKVHIYYPCPSKR